MLEPDSGADICTSRGSCCSLMAASFRRAEQVPGCSPSGPLNSSSASLSRSWMIWSQQKSVSSSSSCPLVAWEKSQVVSSCIREKSSHLSWTFSSFSSLLNKTSMVDCSPFTKSTSRSCSAGRSLSELRSARVMVEQKALSGIAIGGDVEKLKTFCS